MTDGRAAVLDDREAPTPLYRTTVYRPTSEVTRVPRSQSRPAAPDPAAPLSTPVFHILLSLVDTTLHGYAIIQDVRTRTDGEVRLTASTLYAAVKRLLDAGWIEELERSRAADGEDARRRYYRITPLGRDAARAEARRLERLTAQARAKRLIPEPRPSAKGAS